MADDDKRKPYLTPNEVAELLLVSPITVRQWAQKGLLPARLTAGGHRRFHRETVEAFARRMGITEVGDPADELRVLVVDDDRQLNGFLVELLRTRGSGVQVAAAFDGFEAGRLVQTFKPHVVVLDLMMPGLDGFEVCRRLKNDVSTLHIRVVAMTGHYAAETAKRILAAGADRFLKKPFESRELLEACGVLDRAHVS